MHLHTCIPTMSTPLPPNLTLRPATQADEPTLRAIIRGMRLNPVGLDWRRFVVVVDADGRLIACGQVKPHRDGSRELASLAVTRPWRRQGVAGAIIHHLQSEHGPPLWLTCASRMTPFYELFGFARVTAARQMPFYFRLASSLFNLYLRLRRFPVTLAVMRWPSAERGT